MFCGDCGTENLEGASFCSNCGKPLGRLPSDHSTQPKTTTSSNTETQSYYEAAIGPKNTDYYLSIFERFDKNGARVSWNWPSFFVTFYWFLYRKMWGWAVLYYVLPVFLGFLIGAAFSDSENGLALFYLAYLALIFLIFPMYANVLYYRNLKKKIQKITATTKDEQKALQTLTVKGGTSNIVLIIVAVLVIISFLGILAAIALPAYQDYTIRAKMSEPIAVLAEYKSEVSEFYLKNGEWPDTLSILDAQNLSLVRDIAIDRKGVLRVTLAGTELTNGKSIELRPEINSDYSISWTCGSVDVEPKYLPSTCRN